jgi:predicted DNA repair protein MutK
MAGASLLTLLDDIAALLDDVSLMTKVAAKKTAGVLGDDLALNAQQVSGIRAERELPVVWAVAKGSFKNKLILVPAALLISAFAPWLVTPLLMVGGAFLCYEGFEKLAHTFFHSKAEDQAKRAERLSVVADTQQDIVAFEQDKIKGAIRTDFILSAEIIAITLGTVALASFSEQVLVLSIIAIVITCGVYGLVAGIVKLDDAGLHLSQLNSEGLKGRLLRSFGRGILTAAPFLMKGLSIVGTAAMFMVGGGILVHGVHAVQQWVDGLAHSVAANSALLTVVLPTLFNALIGIAAGAVVLLVVSLATRLWHTLRPSKSTT